MEANQWKKIADDAKELQDARNRVFNKKCFSIIDKHSQGKKVFDYGCGWGEFADLLYRKNFQVEAYDDANEMVMQARKNFPDIKVYYKKDFLSKIDSLENKYDIVVSNLVVCILEEEKQIELVTNIKKIVKENGLVVISMCHPAFDFLTQGIVTKRMTPYKVAPKYTDTFKYRKRIHENRIDFDDYHRPLEYYFTFFKNHGLQIIDIAESDTLKTSMYPDFIIIALRLKD